MSYSVKRSREEPSRSFRPRKRHFRGNEFTQENSEDKSTGQSASAKKINISSSDEVCYDPLLRLIEFYTVFTALAEILICYNKCKIQ